ncbi:MAG: hypothetical protein JWN27_2292 [Candidatus Eremiobacteraeota bacterium]|nr:hypothetical protein [Candidatus Eremiobacteraeota bacterium]
MQVHQFAVSAGNERDVFSGGLFVVRDGVVSRIDWLPTAGIAMHGRRFHRVASQRQHDGAEALIYDDGGVASYLRIDGLDDPHDLLVRSDGTILCVSPSADSIVTVAPDGSAQAVYRAGDAFDAWHVNCITEHDGRLYATAFGRFERHRGWQGAPAGAGILFDLETGKDVVGGLHSPHTPRWLDGAWTICNSGAGTVVRVVPGGERTNVELGGFPRGLCAIGDRIYVGVSELRSAEGFRGTSAIAVLDRATWTELGRIPLEGGNPYDLVPIDDATADALRLGFGFSSRRRRNLDQLAMFDAVGVQPSRLWAIGDALGSRDRRVSIAASIPARVTGRTAMRVRCRVTSRSEALLATAPPHPVYVSYRWLDADGAEVPGDRLRTPLPATLPPKGSLDLTLIVAPPNAGGCYTLVLTLVQEGIGWFDDADATSAHRTTVEVD